MTVAESTEQRENESKAGKIWCGPETENVHELVSSWPSLGHYFFHKLTKDYADTILIVSSAFLRKLSLSNDN